MANLITRSPPSPEPLHLRRAHSLEHLERMALVTGNYVNVADGASQTLHRIVDSLVDHGVDVAVIAPDGEHNMPPPQRMFETPSIPLPIQGYQMPLGLGRRTRARLEAFDPQLIHVSSPDPACLMAIRYAKRHDLPLISSFHTNFPAYLKYWGTLWGLFSPVASKLLEWFYAPCDQVFVPTPSMGEALEEQGILDEWAILARGVDTTKFGPRFRSMDWRRRKGLGVEERVVLFCARIVWEKGLRTLVATVERLRALERERGIPHRVLIVGDGDQLDWLKRQLPDAVFTGFLAGRELSRAYASADIFLYPSTTETFGNVTLEAMASGLPVVGARAPGTRSIVVEGESGLLAEPDDPESMAAACEQLLSDDTLRRRLGRGALTRARQYRWPEVLDSFAAELDAFVARRSLARLAN